MNRVSVWIRKYGFKTVFSVMAVDGYRRTVLGEIAQKNRLEAEKLKMEFEEELIKKFSEEFSSLSVSEQRIERENFHNFLIDKYKLDLDKFDLAKEKAKLDDEKKDFYLNRESFEEDKAFSSHNSLFKEAWKNSLDREEKTKAYNENKTEANKIEMDKSYEKYEEIKKQIENNMK